MADRTALTAGIAAASIAAVVAATPALITPNNQDLQVTSAAVAVKQVSTDVQLAAFTLAGFLSAFADGYLDETYNPEFAPNGEVPTVSGEAGAIYYTLDNLLPAALDFDDHFFTGDDNLGNGLDLSNFYANSLVDIGVSPELAGLFASFLQDPLLTVLSTVGGDLGELAYAFLNDPIGTTALIVGGEDAYNFVVDPIGTVLALGGPLGELANDFINDPISTVVNTVAGDLGPLVNAFINDPVGTTAALLGDDVYNFVVSPVQELAHIIAGLLGQQQVVATLGLKSGSTEKVADVAATETKAPTLFKVDLPTPEKVVSDIASVFTPKKKVEKVAVEAVSADVEGDAADAEVEAPKAPKFKLPTPEKAIADFNDGLASTAKNIANALKPKKEKDTSDESDTKKADASDSKKDKPKGFGGFGHRAHKEKAAASTAAE